MAMRARATMLRLQREIVELEKEPLEGVEYHFCNEDMSHMCLILTPQSGPFHGLSLHLDVSIPDEFPRSPPKVSIQTNVEHPNVLGGGYICCDILRPRNEWAADYNGGYNGGYTPAYLLKYIFYQLLSFFTVEEVDQDYGSRMRVVDDRWDSASTFRKRAEAVVKRYVCKSCGFNSTPSTTDAISSSSNAPSAMDTDVPEQLQPIQCSLGELDADSWLRILDQLSDQDMHSLARAWSPVKQLQQYALIRRQLICFYLRKTHVESVLGIGLRISDPEYPRSSFRGGNSGNFVPRATSVEMLDLISKEAYTDHGVRTGIYGENFNLFLPIAIEISHFRRAETSLKSVIVQIHRAWVRPDKAMSWPLCIVEVLPRLMNHTVLALVNDCDVHLQSRLDPLSRDQRWTVKRSSEKALQGYCLLLDLFETLTKRFPEVERELRSRVRLFQSNAERRHKDHTPDLGQFLTYLLVLKEDWKSQTLPVIRELLSRNVVWYLEGDRKSGTPGLPHLAYLEDPEAYVSHLRLQQTFKASSRSLKLSMFQVAFLRLVISKDRQSYYGYPSAEDSTKMFQQTQAIYAVKDWDACLRIWEYPIPDPASNWRPHVCKMLITAISDSERAKYHVTPYTRHYLAYWRHAAEPSCPPPSWWIPGDAEKYNLRQMRPGCLSFFPRTKSYGSKPR